MPIRGAIVDLDGTVYRGGDPIPGAVDGLRAFRAAGVSVLFFSNNPVRSPAGFARKLRGMGIDADPAAVVTSGVATAEYLLAEHPGDACHVVGEDGLREQLAARGLDLVAEPTAADVLVASYDRGFDYDRLTDGLRALRAGAAFVGTDPDGFVPAADGDVVPGSGAVVGAIGATVDREPEAIPGKPSAFALDLALDRLGVAAGDCLVVGDRLDTDVALGKRAGATTALVTTGATTRADLGDGTGSPDRVLDSLAGLSALLDGGD